LLRLALVAVGGLTLFLCFALACAFVYVAPALPTAENMHSVELAVPLRVYSRSGALVSQIGEQRRIPVTFEEVPPLVWKAVLASEDDRFFEHHGIDWMGVLRAVVMNVATASAGQGASTITQQAARNMFLSLDKTARRKLSEVFVTYRMERDFTKEQILATYLNVVPFGQRAYGIAAAAETYYGKRLDELTVAQAATLAGIIQRPSRQNPVTDPKAAAARRAYVLRRMRELGDIDEATAAAAAAEPAATRRYGPLSDVEAPYVAEMVRQEVVRRYGEAAVNAGYKVFTTLDDRLQTAANRALAIGLMEYDKRHGYRGAIAKVKVPTGASPDQLDALLSKQEAAGLLQPAVVTKVADTSATVHIRFGGDATIRWEGLSWARRAVRGGVGAAVRKAADVVAVGDVVFVVTDQRGNALLGQLPQAQSALVALDPGDGAIVSLVGGFDFYRNKFNRVTQARRQPGSGFKPFLYSAALENGFTPATVVLDMPPVLERSSDQEENWRPENSSKDFGGPTRLREALVRSRNLVSIRVLQSVGPDAVLAHAEKFGFKTDSFPRTLSLALGTQVVSPLEMATGFTVFANGGFKVDPYFISRIEDSSGKVLYQAEPKIACPACEQAASYPVLATEAAPPEAAPADGAAPATGDAAAATAVVAAPVEVPRVFGDDAPEPLRRLASLQGGIGYLPASRIAPRVLSPQNTWLMNSMLHDVAMRGTAQRTKALGRDDLAGKTGTNGERDLWFNGFNSRIVASVWVGYDDERPLGESEQGGTAAVPIWMHYMREALRGVPSSTMPRPGGLIDLKVNALTGALASPGDPNAVYETFMLDHQPRAPEPGDPGYSPANGDPGRPADKGSAEPIF
jgi:penicillin-binding protein 1A